MSSYWKDILRTIKGSFARFLAILAIIALGVGFFSGLTLTMPCFLDTGDKYLKENNFYDFRLISTIGFEDEDISKISNLEGVKYAEGAYFKDAITMFGNSNREGSSDPFVVRYHSLLNNINLITLESGRLPESPNEIVVDGYRFNEDIIGTTFKITENNSEDSIDAFNVLEFTVVGVGRSPLYMNFQRGTTNVGSGSIYVYAYMLPEVFASEYFTEAYVYYGTDYYIYSDEYQEFVDSKTPELEDAVQRIIEERYDSLLGDIKDELQDGKDTLEEERSEAWQELEDGRLELIDAREEIEQARIELEDAYSEILDARSELENAQREIDEGYEEINRQEAELNAREAEIDAGISQANTMRQGLSAQLNDVTDQINELTHNLNDVNAAIEQITVANNLGIPLPEGTPSLTELMTTKAMLEAGLTQAQEGQQQLQDGISQIDNTLAELQGYKAQIAAGRNQISEARARLDDARQQVLDGLNELALGNSEYEDALEEFESGLKDYYDGWDSYYEGLYTFQREIAAANRELNYYQTEIDNAIDADTYVLDRKTNVGYVSFENDSKLVDGIAKVFPVFFFALAALVCSTTMSRMVSDERSQIGTMRALGYSDISIAMKYILYSGSASVAGCIAGYFIGIRLFPAIIWSAYGMMYGFAPCEFTSDPLIFVLVMLVSLLCSVGVTCLTIFGELSSMPAELIRPKAPVAGKRILLERMTFIWKYLHFTWKVSIRNVFRFKKRMWMMIIGIAGCTALLFAAFGIRDSINDVVDVEYDTILTYHVTATFKDNISEESIRKTIDNCNEHFGVESDVVLVRNESVSHHGTNAIREFTLIVSDDPNVGNAIHTFTGDELVNWPGDNEVAISSKLAEKNNLKAGDMITLNYGDNGENFTLRIAYVFENYTFHYALMNAATYENCFDKPFEPTSALVIRSGDNSAESTGITDYDYGSYLASNSNVKAWSAITESRESFRQTIKQLNSVVFLVIGCAAALAFIVLFNLNNINITERIREIATIKVLGFREGETGMYMFRENLILVFMGFVLGVPLGIVFHRFVINQIDIDMVKYMVKILPISYVYSFLLVVLFSLIVDVVMRIKISKIDMAESLKGME